MHPAIAFFCPFSYAERRARSLLFTMGCSTQQLQHAHLWEAHYHNLFVCLVMFLRNIWRCSIFHSHTHHARKTVRGFIPALSETRSPRLFDAFMPDVLFSQHISRCSTFPQPHARRWKALCVCTLALRETISHTRPREWIGTPIFNQILCRQGNSDWRQR